MFIYKLHKKNYSSFYKNDTSEKIWYIQDLAGDIGPYYFSFNRKVVFNFWKDYPHFLTNRQIRIFKAENPEMAALKPTKRGGPIKEYSAKEALELIHKCGNNIIKIWFAYRILAVVKIKESDMEILLDDDEWNTFWTYCYRVFGL